MRILIINLLATAMLLFGASSASAYAFNMEQNGGPGTGTNVAPSDVITMDIYLDADISGTPAFQLAILFDDDGMMQYDEAASTTASYILYTGGKGATYLVPGQTRPPLWGGTQQPGKQQVNVNYLENSLGFASATGSDIWIAQLVFHVASLGDGSSTIELTLLGNGSTVVSVGGADISSTTGISGSYTFVPEPTTALLIGFGLVGLTLAGRRRR
jgi:hypothetical protein